MPDCLLIVSGPYEGQRIQLNSKEPMILGRGRANPISLPLDPCLSTRHARLELSGHHILVKDLNSSNGSFIQGQKLSPAKPYQVRNFLVLGSTILKREPPKREQALGQPISLAEARQSSDPNLKTWLEYAGKLSQKTGKQYIDTTSLLLAFFLKNPDIMNPICSDFMIDPEFLKSKWEKDHYFEVPRAWLNDFMVISHKQKLGDDLLVTPLASELLKRASNEKDPLKRLALIFGLPFNLCYPLLDWEKTKVRWAYSIEKLTREKAKCKDAPPPPKAKAPEPQKSITPPKPPKPPSQMAQFMPGEATGEGKLLVLPDRFWNDLAQNMAQPQPVVLLGHKGSGKSSILQHVFHPESNFYQKKDDFILYDSRVFLILNSDKKLERFMASLIRDLSLKDFVGIDHLDHLLMNLQDLGIDRGPLIQALKKPVAHVLIGLDMENRSMISGLLDSPKILYLGTYLDQVREDLYKILLRRFELKVKCMLSSDARHFIQQFVIDPSPDNIASICDFLDLATRRAQGIDFPFHELSSATLAGGQLGRRFFQALYEDWVGVGKGHALEEEDPLAEDPFKTFAYQLEDLVQAFSKNALKIGLHYSDQTRSLRDHRNLNEEEKLQQLKSQIVCLLTAYQHAFQKWFPGFWNPLSPDELRRAGSNPRKLWQMFEERAELIDEPYAEDQFNEATSRVFQELYRQ